MKTILRLALLTLCLTAAMSIAAAEAESPTVAITSPASGDTVSGKVAVRVETDEMSLSRYAIFLVDDVHFLEGKGLLHHDLVCRCEQLCH